MNESERIELLVVIDKRDPETERDRADEVSGIVGADLASMDEMSDGIDLLFYFDTVEEAEEASARLNDVQYVASYIVNAMTL